MTNEELSNEFDVLVASYVTAHPNSVPDQLKFNEYEKSVFLTESQEELVVALYNGTTAVGSFEGNESVTEYLSNLIVTTNPTKLDGKSSIKLSSKSEVYELPSDCMFIIYEQASIEGESCDKFKNYEVVPTTHDVYHRIKGNPFRGPKDRVLRLSISGNLVELISDRTISNYTIRYIKYPQPIILTPLLGGVKINGESKETECKLNQALHRTILESAVQKAIATRRITNNTTTN